MNAIGATITMREVQLADQAAKLASKKINDQMQYKCVEATRNILESSGLNAATMKKCERDIVKIAEAFQYSLRELLDFIDFSGDTSFVGGIK